VRIEQTDRISCVVVTRPESHGKLYCLYRIADFSAADEFDGCEEGDSIVLTFKTMTKAELDVLPEFEGW
jgi:hypothetical protein